MPVTCPIGRLAAVSRGVLTVTGEYALTWAAAVPTVTGRSLLSSGSRVRILPGAQIRTPAGQWQGSRCAGGATKP